MTSEFLGNALFFLLAFAWMMYLVQELFITGSSALNLVLAKDEQERKQIQYSSGLHWDGIEVWLIAALTMTLGIFPEAFSTIYTYLYVVIFLLLYALITRGIVIETIHKLDSETWKKWNARAWAISSALIMFLLGVYVTNLFYGFPLDENGLSGNFFSIFSTTTIAGGLFFFVLSITAGASWIALTTEGDMANRGLDLVKTVFFHILVPVLLLLVFMGFNVHDRLFVGTLFLAYPVLFVLPALAFVSSMLVLYFGFKKEAKYLFIFSLLTMAFYIITGFVGSFPDVMASRIDSEYALTIENTLTQLKSATVIFWVAIVIFPIVIGYQGWKYKKFATKLAKDFE